MRLSWTALLATLLILVPAYSAFPNRAERAIDKTTILTEFNMMRTTTARKLKLPRMAPMVWSEQLVEQAKKMNPDCGFLLPGTSYRYLVTDADPATDAKEKAVLNAVLARLSDKDKTGAVAILKELSKVTTTNGPLEFLDPVQTQVGCIDYTCNTQVHLPGSNGPVTMNYKTLCLVGPNGGSIIDRIDGLIPK